MVIRYLNNDERSDALILAREVLFGEKGSWSEEGAGKISSFLQEYTDGFAFLGAFKDKLEGILIHDADSLRIVFLAVREESRHERIAASLLGFMVERAKEMHLPRLRLNAAASACGFYEKCGFERAGETTDGDGFSFVPMEYLLQRDWLGKTVTVIVDRPYGSFHPHLPDVLYPVNYGYVKELAGGEGEFQDAYVIGPEEPVERFTGIVAGILYRREEDVSRWIVMNPAERIGRDRIISLIGFEEQYYDCRVIWADENGRS